MEERGGGADSAAARHPADSGSLFVLSWPPLRTEEREEADDDGGSAAGNLFNRGRGNLFHGPPLPTEDLKEAGGGSDSAAARQPSVTAAAT